MNVETWKIQIKKGYLEYYLLLLLEQKERYGFEILEQLKDGDVVITEGTLYPMLSRLSKELVIEGRWVTDQTLGHPRKYYRLTKKGTAIIEDMKKEWEKMSNAIQTIGG